MPLPASEPIVSTRTKTRERFLALLALTGSILVHGAVVAGIFWLGSGTPPKPLPVIAVQIVGGTALSSEGGAGPKPEPALSAEAAKAPDGSPNSPSPQVEPAMSTVASERSNQSADTEAALPETPQEETVPPVASDEVAEVRPEPEEQPSLLPDPVEEAESRTETAALSLEAKFDPPKPARRPQFKDPIPSKARFEASLAELKGEPGPSTATQPTRKLDRLLRTSSDGQIRRSAVSAGGKGLAMTAALTVDGGESGEGGGVTTSASYVGPGLSNPPPKYPYRARRKGQEGRAILRVKVTASGDASAVWVIRSSGHRLLDDAAVDAVRGWRFQPASRSGTPVDGLVDVPIAFRLTEK